MDKAVTRRAKPRARRAYGASRLTCFALALALAVALLLFSAPADADPIARWRVHIEEASVRFGIPALWIERVMRAESGGRTRVGGRPIVSRAGAMGLMQLMPGTWAEMRAAHGLGQDPHDPRDNILAGAAYLRAMFDRFGYPALFAGYNAGPGRLRQHLATGRALPTETRAYLRQVANAAIAASSGAPEASPPTLFAVRRSTSAGSGTVSAAVAQGSNAEAPDPAHSPLFLPLSER